MKKYIAIALFSCLSVFGGWKYCQPPVLGKEAYMARVSSPDGGLKRTAKSGHYELEAWYVPVPFMALRQSGGNPSREVLEGRIGELEGTQYFTLRMGVDVPGADILKYGAANDGEAQQLLYYFSYSFQSHIYVEQDGERIPCSLLHFERSYDLTTGRTFSLAFDDPALGKGDCELVVESPLFEKPVRMAFSKGDAPILKMDN